MLSPNVEYQIALRHLFRRQIMFRFFTTPLVFFATLGISIKPVY